MAAPTDNAIKAKIISHMNDDHHDSIIRYLQYYHRLSPSQAYDGRMTGVDLNGLTLQANAKSYRIPFHPPLTSYAQVRERVVELDALSIKMLRLSDVTVKSFKWPTGLWAVFFLAAFATWIGYSQRWWFVKGGPVAQVAGEAFAALSYRIQPWIFGGLLGSHSIETVYFATQILPKHSVNPRTSTYWLWSLSVLIEGQFAYKRFDWFVKRLSEKKAH